VASGVPAIALIGWGFYSEALDAFVFLDAPSLSSVRCGRAGREEDGRGA
jgi:hypothetical protein